jgi:hypothetical protein
MKRFAHARSAVLALVCIALGTVFGPTLARGAVDSVKDVIVRNSTSEPVPVAPQGTTQVGGTVKVDDSTPVKVQGSNAQLDRFQVRKTLFITSTSTEEYGFHELFTVPEGKRFVSDFVSVKGDCFFLDPDAARSLSALNAEVRRMDIPLDVTRRFDHEVMFQQAFPIVLWADAGTLVYWDLRSNADTCAWDMNLAGHFEPST